MRKPVSGDTKIRELCRKFVTFCEHWFIKSFVRPIFFLLPPSILSVVATRSGLILEIEALLGPTVGQLLRQSALLVLITAYIYVVLLKSFYSAIEHYSKPERELCRDDIVAILNSLNVVVGDKSKRFSEQAKDALSSSNIDPGKVFNKITQPKQQIGLLVTALRG